MLSLIFIAHLLNIVSMNIDLQIFICESSLADSDSILIGFVIFFRSGFSSSAI